MGKENEPIEIYIPGKEPIKVHPIPEVQNLRRPTTTYESGKERLIFEQERFKKEIEILQEKASIEIPTQDPIFIMGFGDSHWGSVWTDYEKLDRHLKLIEETPGAYMFCLGNLIDNFIPASFPDGMMTNPLSPEEQLLTFKERILRLANKDKILGAVSSECHEGWTKKVSGQDINRWLFGETEVPIMKNGGIVTLKVGDTEYKNAVFHQAKWHGTVNKENAPRRIHDRVKNVDIVWTAHVHTFFGYSEYRYYEDQIELIGGLMAGCYKVDEWRRGRTGQTGEPGGQGVILFPDKKTFVIVPEPELGIEIVEALTYFKRLEAIGAIAELRKLTK